MWKNKLLTLAIALSFLSIISIFFPYDLFDGRRIFGFVIKTKPYNELGDFISGITAPCVSLSAFILIFLTYRSQQSQYNESKKVIDVQMFDSFFFNTINLIIEIKRNFRITDSKNKLYQGDESILYLKKRIKELYDAKVKNSTSEEANINNFKMSSIKTILEKYDYVFEQYYEIIKMIINKIETNSIIKNKVIYLDVIKTQLSLDELCIILFFNEHYKDSFLENTNAAHLFLKRRGESINIIDLLLE